MIWVLGIYIGIGIMFALMLRWLNTRWPLLLGMLWLPLVLLSAYHELRDR